MSRVDGKVVIVTGGTQGIGEGIARLLAERGAAGLVICGRNHERGAAVAASIGAAAPDGRRTPCLYVPADLSNPADCAAVVAACDERFGTLHGLVNAAGLTHRGTLDNTSVDLWDLLFAVNVRAPFLLTQSAVRIMRREGIPGSIVNIITMSSHGGQPFIMAYSASKGALATLTKNNAHALRAERVRVNGINMGWADTPNEHLIQKADGNAEDWLSAAEPGQPFGRLLRPLDIAHLCAYLLSDDAEMMTGALIDFDQNVMGGYD